MTMGVDAFGESLGMAPDVGEAHNHSLMFRGPKDYRGIGDKDRLRVGENPDTRLQSEAYDGDSFARCPSNAQVA
jgi:hypothetical protein